MRLNRLGRLLCLSAALVMLGALSQPGSVRTAWAQQSGPGKDPAQADRKKNSTESTQATTIIRVPVNEVVTPVTVTDSGGQFVYDVEKEEFKIYDNGKPQQMTSFGTEMQSLSLVIIVETNDSTSALLDDVRPLGSMFSELVMGPQGQAALITYSDHVDILQGMTSNGDKIDTALRTLKGRSNGIHLDDALALGMQMLENYRKDRRVLIVFSDGFNLGSQTGKNEIIKRAMNSNVTVYGLGFNTTKALWSRPQKDPPPDLVNESVARAPIPNMAGTPTQMDNFYNTTIPLPEILLATGETVKATVFKNSLEYFASYSGGRFYKKWGKSTVQEALNQIATEIHGQYELAYVPNNQDEEGFHRIKVEVRRPGARVRARTGWFNYVPPK